MGDFEEQKLIDRILGRPDLYPDEMKAWIVRWVQDNPNFKLPAIALPNVESIRYIGGVGQPAFQNSWVAYAGGYEEPGFYKDPFGRVYLSGLMKSGTFTTPAFTLPVGYRPRAAMIFSGIDGADTAKRVDVAATGEVVPQAGNNAYISLTQISFKAFA